MKSMITVPPDEVEASELTLSGQRSQQLISLSNAPWTKMSLSKLTLTPGQVGNPHNHRTVVTPMIYLTSGDPVATFLGDDFSELVWIKPGEWGSIGFADHVCVYPRLRERMPDAIAYEIRNDGDFLAHTWVLPEKWVLVRRRVRQLGWDGLVTWPQAALEAFHAAEQPVRDPYETPVPLAPDIILEPYGG